MDFGTARLEAPSRISEYPPKSCEEERGRRIARRSKTPPSDEGQLDDADDHETHQFDDLV